MKVAVAYEDEGLRVGKVKKIRFDGRVLISYFKALDQGSGIFCPYADKERKDEMYENPVYVIETDFDTCFCIFCPNLTTIHWRRGKSIQGVP